MISVASARTRLGGTSIKLRSVWRALGQSRGARLAGWLATFCLLTVVMTWPLAPNATTAVQDLGDPLYEIWAMRWVQHQALADPAHLWEGNTGYPFPHSLLFSEPRLSTALLAWPVYLLTGNDVLTYNLMFLATFVILALGMTLLVEEITGNAGAGFLAGLLAAFAPYRYGHLSHLNLLTYGWLPLALWALIRYVRRRSPVDALLAALFLTIQVLASDTIALLSLGAILLAVPFLLWPARRSLTLPFGAGLFAALALPLLALLPVIEARFEVNQLYGFTRDLDLVRAMSATPRSYISVSPGNALWAGHLPVAYPNPLFPGIVTIAGSLAALGFMLAGSARRSRWLLYATLLGLGAFVLSLGPDIAVRGTRVTLPYRWLYDYMPGMTAMRDVARFGMIALLGVQIAAGIGFAAAWQVLRLRLTARWSGLAGAMLVLLLIVVAVAELRTPAGAVTVPRTPERVAACDWLAEQPPGPVIEFPADGLWRDLGTIIRQIYFSTRHWHPIMASYTSFLPERQREFFVGIHDDTNGPSWVTTANVGVLQDAGIRYVLIHQQPGYDWAQAVATADRLPELQRAGRFGDTMAYRLDPGQRAPVRLELATPETMSAGQTTIPALLAFNTNPSPALTILRPPLPDLTATWLTPAGQPIAVQHVESTLPVVVKPGTTAAPIPLTAPSTPGSYRLRLAATGLAPIETDVTVRVRELASGGQSPPLALQRVDWADRVYHSGERVDFQFEWRTGGPVTPDAMLTVQLLDEQERLAAQWDGRPEAGSEPLSRWQPGTTGVSGATLRLPAGMRPGRYRVLIAVYDIRSPTLAHLTLEFPDGSTGTRWMHGVVTIGDD